MAMFAGVAWLTAGILGLLAAVALHRAAKRDVKAADDLLRRYVRQCVTRDMEEADAADQITPDVRGG